MQWFMLLNKPAQFIDLAIKCTFFFDYSKLMRKHINRTIIWNIINMRE